MTTFNAQRKEIKELNKIQFEKILNGDKLLIFQLKQKYVNF